MQLIEVTDGKLADDFIEVNVLINKGNPDYIRPLNKDINEVFDPKKNKAFRFGEVIRWILKDDEGNLIGRIAAFTNSKYKSKGDQIKVGGIGFFDCINDQQCADMLIDVSKHWLLSKGMEAMDGPINFGERDRWWGLLTEGFQEPLYCMNYNPPYYQALFENYGFKNFFNQICYGLNPKDGLTAKVIERHKQVSKNPDIKAVHIKKNNLEKFAADFTIIYNKAWAGHGGIKQIEQRSVLSMFNNMKQIMDERINWFVYDKEQPIAMFINIPDLNQWFKYLNGRFDIWHKLKFLILQKTKPCKKFNGLVFGVVPEYHGMGIDSFMITVAGNFIRDYTPYTEYEMQWIGDFNPKMLNIAESLGGAFQSRKLITYRYLFDRTQTFHRHPILE
jgi:hypothetical protein